MEKRLKRLKVDAGMAYALSAGNLSYAAIPAAPDPVEPAVLERILGTSDLMGVSFLELGLLMARTVGRVHCRNQVGQVVGYGTGFLVSPRLLMTNHHVLENPEMAAFCQVEFDYQVGLDGKTTPSAIFGFIPGDFFLTDPGLDYTLVAVQPRLSDGRELKDYGWNWLYEEEGKVIKGEYVNIIQHPNGEPKQLALRETSWKTPWRIGCTTAPTPPPAPRVRRCSMTSGRWWDYITRGCPGGMLRAISWHVMARSG